MYKGIKKKILNITIQTCAQKLLLNNGKFKNILVNKIFVNLSGL